MEHGLSPAVHGTPSSSSRREQQPALMDFPQFPGEDFYAHAGTQYKEQAEARFANLKLLGVAEGLDPPSANSIVDIDLTTLPELPASHRTSLVPAAGRSSNTPTPLIRFCYTREV